jgi:DNA-binding NarL/FixJ family response regulator
MKKIPLIIADESSVIRSGLAVMLQRNSFLEIKERCASAVETLEKVKKHKKAVIIADPHLPGLDLSKFPATIKEHCPASVIILHSHVYDPALMQHVKNKNVDAYITKNTTAGEIEEAARAGFDKKPFTGKAVNESLTMQHLKQDNAHDETGEELTDREKEVRDWMLRGLSRKKIAGKLFISTQTVDKHWKKVLKKTRHESQAILILDALQKGIITVEEIRKWKLK